MPSKNDFLIETDLLIDHLINDSKDEISQLETAMIKGNCFTTVINASELYFAVKNDEERKLADKVMNAVKVLGLHPRYSLSIGEFREKVANIRDAMICALAKINKMIIVSSNIEKYSNCGIKVVHPNEMRG